MAKYLIIASLDQQSDYETVKQEGAYARAVT